MISGPGWNRDRLYEIMVFGTYRYVPVCTEYMPVRNAENGTYRYVLVCTQYVHLETTESLDMVYTWYILGVYF
jgi:hypothetical protein